MDSATLILQVLLCTKSTHLAESEKSIQCNHNLSTHIRIVLTNHLHRQLKLK